MRGHSTASAARWRWHHRLRYRVLRLLLLLVVLMWMRRMLCARRRHRRPRIVLVLLVLRLLLLMQRRLVHERLLMWMRRRGRLGLVQHLWLCRDRPAVGIRLLLLLRRMVLL